MDNYNKTQVYPYDPPKLAICSFLRPEDDLISNCGQILKKTVSFDDILHFIDDENIVIRIDLDGAINFSSETPTKVRQINRERSYISRSCEKPQCIPSHDQHNCSIDEKHTSNIFLKLYNLWDMVPATLLSLNHTNDKDSMPSQYPQPTNHQPRTDSYPVFSSLRMTDSRKKRLRVSFPFFQRNYLPDERVNETFATVEELSDPWKTGARDGIPPFVMNCNCI